MKLKELMRVLVNTEMQDISVFEVEATAFGSDPRCGEALKTLFLKLAEEKRARLKVLNRLSKEGTGFRQRRTETARSVEASLRTHVTRAARCVTLYVDLLKQLNKPDFKDEVGAMASAERRCLAAIKDLQAKLNKA